MVLEWLKGSACLVALLTLPQKPALAGLTPESVKTEAANTAAVRNFAFSFMIMYSPKIHLDFVAIPLPDDGRLPGQPR